MRIAAAVVPFALVLAVACTVDGGDGPDTAQASDTADDDPDDGDDRATLPAPAARATPIDGSGANEAAAPDADGPDDAGEGTEAAIDTYLAWLAASREPDVDVACDLLTDELIDDMLTGFRDTGWPVGSCAEMTTMTAELYRATGSSAEVDVQVVDESPDAVTLWVTYADGGDCGTVALERRPGWIITENSEGCSG